jgi:predicted nuclease of predicted toxin-antitoxin system
VLDRANADGAVLLTADKDFGELVFRQRRASGGVVLVRLAGLAPDRKAAIVASLFLERSAELAGNFTVIGPSAAKIRRSR